MGAGLDLAMINAFEWRVINGLRDKAKCVVCLLPLENTLQLY
jgi:hypothetical protein